ncbi:hypothetical protein ACFORG_02650 [Lutimaribacter marinistellae]|uniref:Tetratricopeptide repeat-containing protein n=1 Tax=Lutimaribacter marinistellae TaxID=1820329 RepID=A0ABV7TCZ6_9RHOB
MRRSIFLSLIFLFLAGTAYAFTIPVRSGAHPDFTRLTFRIPEGTDWDLEGGEGLARLRIGIEEVVFDTSSVFGRIPRARLNALIQLEPGAPLELSFACDCQAKAFVEGKTLLVVDIQPKQISSSVEVGSSPSTVNLPVVFETPGSIDMPLVLPDFDREVEDSLAKRLLGGVDGEILELKPARIGPRPSSTVSEGDSLTGAKPEANIRIETAMHRDLDRIRGALTKDVETARCFPAEDLNVKDWGDDTSFDEQIGSARARLFGEFDRIDEPAVEDLARLYIHFGFGAEARTKLRLVSETGGSSVLWAVAGVIDGSPSKTSPVFAGQEVCDGPAALWSVLESEEAGETTNATAVERAFSELPVHLRGHLGPSVASALTRGGYIDSAKRILRSVERAGTTENSATHLAEAELAALEKAPETEEMELQAAVLAPDAEIEAAKAIVQLIEKRWTERSGVSDKELDLAASYAREYRTSGIGPEIEKAHVLALALNQDFDRAILLLGRRQGEDQDTITLDRVFALLSENSDDVTFLRHAMEIAPKHLARLGEETSRLIADRLLSLGFPKEALAFADRPRDQPSRRERANLIAAAVLELGRPHRALLELQGRDDEAAQQIRGMALARNGAYLEAAETLLSVGDSEGAARYFWLGDAWEQGPPDDAGAFGEVVDLSLELSGEENLPGTPLADAEALLAQSETVRAQVDALLGKVE